MNEEVKRSDERKEVENRRSGQTGKGLSSRRALSVFSVEVKLNSEILQLTKLHHTRNVTAVVTFFYLSYISNVVILKQTMTFF